MMREVFKPSRVLHTIGILAVAAGLVAVGSAELGFAQEKQGQKSSAQQGAPQQNRDFANAEVHIWPVRGNVYMLVGAGGNITVQEGNDGILLVDTGLSQMSDKVLAAVRSISKGPIRYIVNTHVHADHTGGNLAIAKEGSTIAGGNVVGNIGASASEGATVIAFQTILDRMSMPGSKDLAPEGAWPTDTYTTLKKDMFFNGEAIRIYHVPAAHTDGDSMVFFRRSDVVSTGDIFTTTNYPIVDLERGGGIQGVIDGLNKIIYEITIVADKQGGGTMVIPGHGRLCNQADVVYYQEMVIIIRDRIQAMIDKGMTLEQVEAAKPTSDYDPRYGSTTGFWTTEKFVDAVYKSLSQKPKMQEAGQ